MSNAIPQTYAEWRHCIEVECGIPLAPEFIATRLRVLQQPSVEETQRFIQRYGDAHWRRVVQWFVMAAAEAGGSTS